MLLVALLQIIFANVTNQEKTPIILEGVSTPLEVTFTYSVKWHKTEYAFVYACLTFVILYLLPAFFFLVANS